MIWIDAFNLWKSIYLLVESVINWEIAKNSQLNTPTACFFFFFWGWFWVWFGYLAVGHQLIYSTTNKKWGCCCICTNQCIATSWFLFLQEIYLMVCRGWSSNPRWWCYFFPPRCFRNHPNQRTLLRGNGTAPRLAQYDPHQIHPGKLNGDGGPEVTGRFFHVFPMIFGISICFFGRIFCGSKASRENFPGVYDMGNCSNKLAEPWLDQCNLHARKERQQKPMAGGVVGQSRPRLLQVGGSNLGWRVGMMRRTCQGL